jgi:hypothetical protein
MLSKIQKSSSEIDQKLKTLFGEYNDFYTEANRQFISERSASGNMTGLEDFYRMTQTIRRNRDVIGSLVRGVVNLRSLKEFKVVEEDIPEKAPVKPRKKKGGAAVPVPNPFHPPALSGEEKQQIDNFIEEGPSNG